ncbi:MAG: TVP38/TMEM64 family protein [Cyanobacteria bacterium P01_G01_bin.54]
MTEAAGNKKLTAIFKFIAIIIVVAGILIAAKQLGVASYLDKAIDWVDGLGPWGPIAFIFIYIAASVALLSGAALTLGAGAIFGVVKGSILVSIASTSAAAVAFLIGRYLARGWVAKQIENQPKFAAVDKAVAKEGWKIVGLVRLSPVFPFVFLNYAFGVTQVSFRDYVLASWIGMMPGTVMYVYLGSLAQLAGGAADGGVAQTVLKVVGLLATIAVTVYVTKIAKKALDEQVDTDASGDPAGVNDAPVVEQG